MPQHFWLFLVGSIVVTVVPGADMALVTRQVVTRGQRAAHATIAGNLSGLVVHATALVVGLSAILVASSTAYTAVKLRGRGLSRLPRASSRSGGARRSSADATGRGAAPTRRETRTCRASSAPVLNPKPALFFLSYLPQFVDRDGSVPFQIALLAAVHILVGFVWLTFYAWCIARVHDFLVRPRIKAALDRTTGAILIALGLRIAAD